MHARLGDPATSHEAIPVNISAQALRVLAAYKNGDAILDHTAYQRVGLAVSGWTHQRCSDLRHRGYIERTGERGTTPSGKSGYLCRITPRGFIYLITGSCSDTPTPGPLMRPKSDLRSYQHRVVDYLYGADEALAVMKMGSGKTVSVLTTIDELIKDHHLRHALIIAPKRVAKSVWPKEIAEWAHLNHLSYAVLDGTPAQRAKYLATAGERRLTIIGTDNVQWLVEALRQFPEASAVFDCLVIDETSRFKDPKSKRGKALAMIADPFRIRWGLTGTPRPNSLLDLFAPNRIITAGKLWGKSYYKWRMDHFLPTDYQGYTWKAMHGHEETILAEAASISITLAEGDMPDLPQLSVIVDEVTLPPDARVVYRDMERKLFAELEDESIVAISQAVATGKLAQIANGFLYGEAGFADTNWLHEAKREWLKDLIEDLNGEPVIVVYEYQADLAMIRELFGDVPYELTDDVIDAWNRKEIPILALHPKSGGHGLNLQYGGSRFAWIAPTWSSELWDQTLARLHRPGQTAHVMVHVCTAAGTVDELKRLRVDGKLSAQAAFEAYLRLSAAA